MRYSLYFLLSCWLFMADGKAQSLDTLLARAYDNNPELKALQLEYEAALQKGPQVSQLPDPTVGVGVPVLPVETRLGAQRLMISASQMFPWWGTLEAKEDVVLTMAKSKYERIAAARLDIDYQIKTAYYYLYLLQAQQQILFRNQRIFETMEKVALAKVESGQGIASDVLGVQLKIEEINKQIQLLEERKQIYVASINAALHQSVDAEIQVDTTSLSLAVLDYDLDAYRKKIQSNHPLIRQLDWSIKVSDKELEVNRLSGMPTLGVGLDYGWVTPRADADPRYNGRDILVPKVMVSIPINQKKYEAKAEEESLKKQAYQLQKENLTNQMIAKIQAYYAKYESAKWVYEMTTQQLKIAQSAYDILLTDYSSKGKRFDELMQLQSDMNRYELERLKAKVETHLMKCEIERLTDF